MTTHTNRCKSVFARRRSLCSPLLLVGLVSVFLMASGLAAQAKPEPSAAQATRDQANLESAGAEVATGNGERAKVKRRHLPLATRELLDELERIRRLPPNVSSRMDDLNLVSAISAQAQQRELVRGLVGKRRWRKLSEARFDMDRFQLDPIGDLHYERPHDYEDIKDTLKSGFLKMSREMLERRLKVDEFRDRHRSEASKTWKLRIDPRLSGGSDPYYGARFRLRTSNEMLSRFSLRALHRTESGQAALKLAWEDENREYQLEHIFGDPERGDVVWFHVRLSF